MIAITRLAPGPAAATQIMSRFGFRRLPQSTGTGLAQPNMKPVMITIPIGTMIVPIGSMCLTGFSVIRPRT